MGLYFWLLAAKPFIYLSGGFMRFAYRGFCATTNTTLVKDWFFIFA
jgi:hypothetical protein